MASDYTSENTGGSASLKVGDRVIYTASEDRYGEGCTQGDIGTVSGYEATGALLVTFAGGRDWYVHPDDLIRYDEPKPFGRNVESRQCGGTIEDDRQEEIPLELFDGPAPYYCPEDGVECDEDRCSSGCALQSSDLDEHTPAGTEAGAILREAAAIVDGVRNQTHGDKERSFEAIASLWSAYVNADPRMNGMEIDFTARDVAWMMVLMKMARSLHGEPARDHFVDAAGYAAVAGEVAG